MERCDAADEGAKLVIAAREADLDRPLGVKVLAHFGLRLEQLLVERGREAGLRDVDQQIVDLGLARELAQHCAE